MVNIQSPTAKIRRGKKKKKKEEEERRRNRMKIYMVSLLHRATIKMETTGQKYNGLPYYIGWP